ncbi:MAG: sugar transferase [Synergistaceae bacterium]|nr:sugar transferase [Synergistaceae bacterium]
MNKVPLDNPINAAMKRTLDIIGALLMLVLGLPLFLFCAIGVRVSTHDPILFKQTRIGKDNKPFTMYKFRSLVMNDEENTAWTGQYDDRRTPFGAFMRHYSLDETMQLINVLKGEMSLVGPRPEIPFFVERFEKEIPSYNFRHKVKPGITGWSQINGLRGDTPITTRTEYDIFYIKNWSFLWDIKILFITVFGAKFVNNEKIRVHKKNSDNGV